MEATLAMNSEFNGQDEQTSGFRLFGIGKESPRQTLRRDAKNPDRNRSHVKSGSAPTTNEAVAATPPEAAAANQAVANTNIPTPPAAPPSPMGPPPPPANLATKTPDEITGAGTPTTDSSEAPKTIMGFTYTQIGISASIALVLVIVGMKFMGGKSSVAAA